MQNLFQNLTTEGMEQVKDSVGGYSPLETGAYDAKIKTIYITNSKNGAMAANLVADIDGREYREQLWITNSKGQNYYVSKQSNAKIPLPGFTVLNDICLCTIGHNLTDLGTEPKTYKIYDMEAKAEMPKEVQTIVDLIGSEVKLGIVKQIVDKQVKDASGNYVPSGETREENVIDKVFHSTSLRTVNEAKAGITEASFYGKWLAKNAGNTRDKTKKDAKSQAMAGAPKPATKTLFS